MCKHCIVLLVLHLDQTKDLLINYGLWRRVSEMQIGISMLVKPYNPHIFADFHNLK